MLIGVCGKSGCGKSTLARLIKENHENAIHLEIDKVGHSALKDELVKEKLVKTFGEKVLNENDIDRKKLGEIVFANRKQMDKLTEITWECMQRQIDEFLSNNKDKIIILDWLLLTKSKYFDMCDIKVLIDIPYEVRLQRAMKRDNITKEAFDLRESASIDFDQSKFDYVFKENSKNEIKRLVNKL